MSTPPAPLPRGALAWVAAMVLAHAAQGAWALRVGLVDDARAAWVLPRSDGVRALLGGRAHDLVAAGGWWRLTSTGLVHVDLFHLFVNALAIGLVGRVVERWIGPWRTGAVLAAGVVGGALVSQLSGIPRSDGASGGAFALVGAGIAVGLRRPEIPADDRRVLVRVLGAVAGINVLLSMVAPTLDAAAHTGGLAVGLGLGAVAATSTRTIPWALVVLAWALVLGLGYAGLLGP